MSTTRPTSTRAVHLASRPHGAPTEDDFYLKEIGLPELADGQIMDCVLDASDARVIDTDITPASAYLSVLDGIDVYYDNVGADHLEAAITHLSIDGRVAMCGAISQYNSVEPPRAPRNLGLAIGKRLTLRGFVIAKYAEEVRPEFRQKMAQWLANDEIHWDETYRDGLDAAPKAFIDMLDGANTGKMLVQL